MFEFNEETAMEESIGSAGKKVLDSGVYDITILTASKTTASTGTTGIDWSIKVDGAQYPNIIYGMWTHRADGTTIFNANIVNALMGIVGAKKLTEIQKEIEVKDGKKTVTAYKELEGVKCKVAIQKVLDVYNGEVTEKNEIKAFFNENGQTFAEAKRSSKPKQMLYYQDKMKDKETTEYKKFQAEASDEIEDDIRSLL